MILIDSILVSAWKLKVLGFCVKKEVYELVKLIGKAMFTFISLASFSKNNLTVPLVIKYNSVYVSFSFVTRQFFLAKYNFKKGSIIAQSLSDIFTNWLR